MTLIEFLESKKTDDSAIGDLAKDALNDGDFSTLKNDEERLEYLERNTSHLGDLFIYFENEFNSAK